MTFLPFMVIRYILSCQPDQIYTKSQSSWHTNLARKLFLECPMPVNCVSQGNDLVACDLATKLMSNDVMTSLGWDNVTCDLAATWPKAR